MPHTSTSSSQAPTAEGTEPADDGQEPRRRSGPALNRVQLIGRLAAHAELRFSGNGNPVYVIWNLSR